MKHNYYTIHAAEVTAAKQALSNFEEALVYFKKAQKQSLNPHLHNEVTYHITAAINHAERISIWLKHFIEQSKLEPGDRNQ